MNYIEITINTSDVSMQEILIAKLELIDFESFEQNDENLKAFAKEQNWNDTLFEQFINEYNVKYSKSIIKEQNWNELWESNFQPVVVDNFVGIRADFHNPISNVTHEIIITPKMSFGTGHHATTHMMLELMQHIDFKNKQVADFGTGTGILAIMASKLGANFVWATDNDDWCIENASENILKNNCQKTIKIEKVTAFKPTQKFDIVIANINKNIILDNLISLVNSLNQTSQLLLSGLLATDENDLLAATKDLPLKHSKTIHSNGWIAMQFKAIF